MRPGQWIDGVACFPTKRRGLVWKIRYRAPVEPNSRVTEQKTETLAHCANRKQAQSVLALRQGQVFDGTYRPMATEAPPRFAEYAMDTFLPSKAGMPVWADYERSLRLHLVPFFGRMFVPEVELGDCYRYRAKRLEEGASPKTIKNELDCLSTMYAMAIIQGVATRDPAAGVDHGKIINRRERLLSSDELTKLLGEISRPKRAWMRPFFVVLYYTGMRISDVCALSRDRISFELNYLAQKQKKTGEWVYPPMHRMLAAELRRWLDEAPPSRWVFPQAARPDRHISRFAVTVPWAEMLKAAGVEDFTRHDMRKLLVTTLKARGASNDAVKGVSGHATDAMVAHYNLGPDVAQLEASREAVDRLPDLVLISPGSKPAVSGDLVAVKKSNNHAQ